MRRTKVTLIYKRTKNLRAVQLLLGHSKLESTVRYLGIEVDDALEISEQTEIQRDRRMPHGLNLSSCGCFWALLRPRETGQNPPIASHGRTIALRAASIVQPRSSSKPRVVNA